MRSTRAGNLFGCASRHDPDPPFFTAFWSKIDQIVGRFDYVEVVLTDKHGVNTKRNEPLQNIEKLVHVGKMQASRWLWFQGCRSRSLQSRAFR